MAEEAQQRVQTALSDFVNEVDKSHLRNMQKSMHLCAAQCCEDSFSSIDRVHRCVENCTASLQRAQNYVQTELGQFQERLQRGVLTCQDGVKAKMGPNPTESEMAKLRAEFESCAVKCVNSHIDQLPTLLQKVKKVIADGKF